MPRMSDIALVLVILLVVVLLWRGPKVLPKFGESLGHAIRNTRRAVDDKFDPLDDRPSDRPVDR
jgi:TatA/E family protein of Tat protein translocase